MVKTRVAKVLVIISDGEDHEGGSLRLPEEAARYVYHEVGTLQGGIHSVEGKMAWFVL
jgi:hypothetical protein